jgi:hypothetical protein
MESSDGIFFLSGSQIRHFSSSFCAMGELFETLLKLSKSLTCNSLQSNFTNLLQRLVAVLGDPVLSLQLRETFIFELIYKPLSVGK